MRLVTPPPPPFEGRGHVSPGQVLRYQGDPPTSGLHDPKWIDSGVYEEAQNRMKLVHSLEHGIIVVYYDTADPATWEVLNDWADLYDYPLGGIVVAPKPGLGEAIVLNLLVQAASSRSLRCRRGGGVHRRLPQPGS